MGSSSETIEKQASTHGSTRIKLLIAYDGTEYAGWQRQSHATPDPRPTIQATLEDALSKIFNSPIKAQSSGRTDAGAHAEGQVVHFNVPLDSEGQPIRNPLTLNQNSKLLRSLNSLTPPSIAVKRAWLAPKDFHALHSATHKTYRYEIHNDLTPNPIRINHCYWHEKPLNIQRLNQIVAPLVGEHDFKSFQTSGTELKTTVRTILSAQWSTRAENEHNPPFTSHYGQHLYFHITGTGFLKQMVRNIVGTTIYLHDNGFGAREMSAILATLDRKQAKATAAAKGLFLERVYYPTDLDNGCLEL